MKYIDADRLKEAVEKKYNSNDTVGDRWDLGYDTACEQILDIIDSFQQEQPDFPTTDEQIKEFLATHPKIKVPEKYKNPDWLFKKQEKPEVDLEKEIDACWRNWLSPSNQKEVEGVLPKTEFATYARHFYELGRKARKEE